MSDIKKMLIEEISRVARKDIKSALQPLTEKIAVLKKEISLQNKRIKELEKRVPAPVIEPPKTVENTDKIPRITKEKIQKIREKLGLSFSDFAKLLDVSLSSVCNWERGKTVPRIEQKVRIASFRDMGKRELLCFLNEKGIAVAKKAKEKNSQTRSTVSSFDRKSLTEFRETHKLTKVQLAALLGVSQFSVRHWESGKSEPRDAQKAKISALFALADEQIQLNLNALPKKSNEKQVVAQGKEQY